VAQNGEILIYLIANTWKMPGAQRRCHHSLPDPAGYRSTEQQLKTIAKKLTKRTLKLPARLTSNFS